MRWVTRFATLSLSLAAAGCLGGYQPGSPGTHMDPPPVDNPPPSDPTANPSGALTARQLFDQNVLTILTSCTSCHAGTGTAGGPKFLGVTGDAYYASLTGDPRFVNNVPEQSYLITHIHAPNEGPDLNMAQDAKIIAWITQENVERALPPPPSPANVAVQELAKFGNCMTLADFTAAGMNDLQNQNTNGGPCTSCHATGAYVYLSNTPTNNFNRLKESPWLMKFALGTINTDGTFKDVEAANRFLDRGKEPGHPQYTLNTTRATALTTFFTSTYTKYKAGNCPTTPPPSP